MSVASASTTVKVHEFPSGNIIHNYQPGTHVDGPIRSVSWSKDGNWLALVPHSGLAEIISVKDQLKLIHTIQGIEEPSCAAFQNTTKKNIAVGTLGGQVLVYDIKARSVKKRYPRITSSITRVEFTAKDNHVVAACENGEAFLYSNVHNNVSGTFKIPRSQTISALKTSPIKRNYVAAGSNEGVVAVWDIHGNKNKFFMGSHKAPVTAVAFSPVSSDLLVSTGLDRQFCFYDITGNKCIGSVFVENSMTAVDFSPDGKYVLMASKNGKIHIYDSKNVQQPVCSFFGHSGPVEHLSFRKNEDYESSFSLNSDIVKESSDAPDCFKNNESFSLNVTNYSHPAQSVTSQTSSNAEDSFMAALSLDQNNTTGSVKQNLSTPAEISRRNYVHKYTPTNPSKLLQEGVFSDRKVPITSTPDCINFGMPPVVSPIVSINPNPYPEPSTASLEEFVRSTVKEELSSVTRDIKNDMKYYSTHNIAQTRQMLMGMTLSMIKEFLKVENSFDNLRTDLVCDMTQNQALLEENFMLKQKVAELEEEIATLRSNQFNGNV